MKAKKTLKKLLAMTVSAVMVCAMAVPAFAADTVNITINDPIPQLIAAEGDAVLRSYNGYLLLNATVSADGKNYSYTVNEKYRAVLQEQVYAAADDSFWGGAESKPSAATEVTDAQILKYLESLTGDEGTWGQDGYVAGSLRGFADKLYRAIKAKSITADAETDGTIIGAKGYWLIADVTDVTGDAANSLVVVDTKGNDDLVVTPKTDVPTVEKKVKETNDSTGVTSDWQDGADYDIGDDVPFQLTGTLPTNISSYETYKYVFHDELSDGLTLNEESIKVEIGGKALTKDTDYTVNTSVTDGCDFEIVFADLLKLSDITKDSKIVVTYTAELNGDAVIGGVGNPNEVHLEFSNNPYDEGTGKTPKDKVTVFTFKLNADKVDKEGEPLKGAGFTLYKYDEDAKGEDKWTAVGDEQKGEDMTNFTWTGLDSGKYKLVESTVPDGYNKAEDLYFIIEAAYDISAVDPKLTDLVVKDKDGKKTISGEGLTFTAEAAEGTVSTKVVNTTGIELPETGGMGTTIFYVLGGLMIVGAGVLLVTKRRMSYEK